MSKIVPLKTYPNRAEANLAKGLFENNDIKAMISADDAGGMHPALMWGTGGVRLLVREEHKETALRLLEDEAGSSSIKSG